MFKQRKSMAAFVLMVLFGITPTFTMGEEKSKREYKGRQYASYACLFVNHYGKPVNIKLVGLPAFYSTNLRANDGQDVASGDTAIIEGERVVIVWDRTNGKRLDFKDVTIDKEKKFVVDNNGKITITDW